MSRLLTLVDSPVSSSHIASSILCEAHWNSSFGIRGCYPFCHAPFRATLRASRDGSTHRNLQIGRTVARNAHNFALLKNYRRWSERLGSLPWDCICYLAACSSSTKPEAEHEEEAIARTEFTDRIENFFEYDALKAGQPSQFLIHLTDLTDGTPIEKAEVTLITRAKGGAEVMQTKARVGKVTGIYVADVAIPS